MFGYTLKIKTVSRLNVHKYMLTIVDGVGRRVLFYSFVGIR